MTKSIRGERLVYIVLGLVIAALAVNLGFEVYLLRGIPAVPPAHAVKAAQVDPAPVHWAGIEHLFEHPNETRGAVRP